MHDALTIAIPTLAVVFAALLNRSDVQALRGEFHTFPTEVREAFKAVRAEAREENAKLRAETQAEFQKGRSEAREDSRNIHGELVALRERSARIEERIGIKAAAS